MMSHFDTVIEETTDPIVRSVCVTRETLNVEPHLCSLIHDNQRVYGDMYFTEGCEHKDCFEDGKLRLSRNADAVYRIKLVDCVDVRTVTLVFTRGNEEQELITQTIPCNPLQREITVFDGTDDDNCVLFDVDEKTQTVTTSVLALCAIPYHDVYVRINPEAKTRMLVSLMHLGNRQRQRLTRLSHTMIRSEKFDKWDIALLLFTHLIQDGKHVAEQYIKDFIIAPTVFPEKIRTMRGEICI